MRKRRCNLEVMADVLRIGQAGKTQIMYAANMSYSQLQKYLDFLTEHGFIDRVASKSSNATYRTTAKGQTLLKLLERVRAMLGQGEPVNSL